jgi:hypothetical protein
MSVALMSSNYDLAGQCYLELKTTRRSHLMCGGTPSSTFVVASASGHMAVGLAEL